MYDVFILTVKDVYMLTVKDVLMQTFKDVYIAERCMITTDGSLTQANWKLSMTMCFCADRYLHMLFL